MKIAALILFALLALFPIAMFGQTDISYGAKTGFALSLHYGTKADPQDLKVKLAMRPGAYAGAWLDLNILPNLALGYELLYAQKGSRIKIDIFRMENEFGEMEELAKPAEMNVKYYMDYIEMPLLFKVKAIDRPKWSMSVITGTAMGFRINGDYELDGVFYLPDGDEFDEVEVTDSNNMEYVNIFDFSFVSGGKLSFHNKIPLSFEYRITLGWDYLDIPTFEGFDPARLRNQSYHIGFSLPL